MGMEGSGRLQTPDERVQDAFQVHQGLAATKWKLVRACHVEHVGDIVGSDNAVFFVVWILIISTINPLSGRYSTTHATARIGNRVNQSPGQIRRQSIGNLLGPGVSCNEVESMGVLLFNPEVHS